MKVPDAVDTGVARRGALWRYLLWGELTKDQRDPSDIPHYRKARLRVVREESPHSAGLLVEIVFHRHPPLIA